MGRRFGVAGALRQQGPMALAARCYVTFSLDVRCRTELQMEVVAAGTLLAQNVAGLAAFDVHFSTGTRFESKVQL
jgi:hypothetical protein